MQTFKASLVFVLKTKLSYGFIHPVQLTDFLLKSYKVNPATLSIPDGQIGQLTFSKSDTTKLRTETANPYKCQALQNAKIPALSIRGRKMSTRSKESHRTAPAASQTPPPCY